ncbi:hypothetical protein BKP35_17445 [Anaerobacillus arseniciselenatis]|uniref:Uncharacterized protein n=1 Tax=Anaerobacillus arseniciselenatis TaxID=85682 RepID=A0A1S2L8M7_9BACI|nr:hypothetical protein BKP35_17445 [Anaerobacillus arseniciselenatis]
MVTLASILTALLLLGLVIIIDMFLYKVSFLSSLQLVFDVHLSIGGMYLIVACLFGLAVAVVIDFRRGKT